MAVIRLDAVGPFDHRAALAMLAAHAIAGLEHVDIPGARGVRPLQVAGRAHRVTISLDPRGAILTTATRDAGLNSALATRVRHWFDLDADVAGIDARLGSDARLADRVRRRQGVRVTRFADGFEAAAVTVLGQQISLAAGRRLGARLVAAYGRPGPAGLRLFPTPARLAREPPETMRSAIGVTNARARTLRAVADLFAAGFRLDASTEPAAARARLLDVPGIGPWTADYLSIRALGDPDRFPSSDAVVRRALGGIDARTTEAVTSSWTPYRSYAAARLWADPHP